MDVYQEGHFPLIATPSPDMVAFAASHELHPPISRTT